MHRPFAASSGAHKGGSSTGAGIYCGDMARTGARDDIWIHVILSILTAGLWLPIWFLIWLSDVVEGWIGDLIGAITAPIFRLLGRVLRGLAQGLIVVVRHVVLIVHRPKI
jgi:hypothetical protein